MHAILADRQQAFRRAADAAALAVVVSLPWSTSATGILTAIWLLTLVPMLHRLDLRQTLRSPFAILPVSLVVLGVLGMAWADGVSMSERASSLRPLHKLLA